MSTVDHHQVARAFGAALKLSRAGARLTQEQLAEAADIDRTYPSLMERGLRQPTLAVVLPLAAAFEIEVATLITMTVARLRGEQL
jgi:transcriptional regulator with XRE-family HTH domain